MSARKDLTAKAVVLGVKEVAEALGCSNNKAYEVIRTLNKLKGSLYSVAK